MERTIKQGHRRRDGGYALIFALAVMVVVLIIGLRFLAVVHSRQKTTNNEKDALQAVLLANAGIERAARELSQDMTWSGSFSDEPLAGGTYSAHVAGQGTNYVIVQAAGTFRDVTRRRIAYVYTPDSSGSVHVWGSCYGSSANEWDDVENLIDSADGETDAYSSHDLGDDGNAMSLAVFDSDVRSVPISQVEIVVSGYVSRQPRGNQSLEVRWVLTGSGETGQWQEWTRNDLEDHVGQQRAGRMYLDVTDDPPSGGWHWGHFRPGTDLELQFRSSGSATILEPVEEGAELELFSFRSRGRGRVRPPRRPRPWPRPSRTVTLYVDCAGFRVTWGGL